MHYFISIWQLLCTQCTSRNQRTQGSRTKIKNLRHISKQITCNIINKNSVHAYCIWQDYKVQQQFLRKIISPLTPSCDLVWLPLFRSFVIFPNSYLRWNNLFCNFLHKDSENIGSPPTQANRWWNSTIAISLHQIFSSSRIEISR